MDKINHEIEKKDMTLTTLEYSFNNSLFILLSIFILKTIYIYIIKIFF